MAQVFHPKANVLAKLSLILLLTGPLILLLIGTGVSRASYNTKAGIVADQPVPFSHEHHVSELGIDCRYCHSNVENSAHATVPATETCMSCHSQIWTNSPLLEPVRQSYKTNTPIKWAQVNKVPEFVYFNHSIHIKRGLNCNICHGSVQQMQLAFKGKPFFMVWCLNCHRNPEKYVNDPDKVFSLYEIGQKGTDREYSSATPEERDILNSGEHVRSPEELAKGEALVKKFGIKKKQLADCWICHR
mgnify:CR=1 FL=1